MHIGPSTQKLIEEALAYLHAALDEPTPERVAQAKQYAAEALSSITRGRKEIDRASFTLSQARDHLERVSRLRALLVVLDRKLQSPPQGSDLRVAAK